MPLAQRQFSHFLSGLVSVPRRSQNLSGKISTNWMDVCVTELK